ncbi:pentapeptide repeat-containing protein [Coleofasciculus sp. G2-EDA-02]|uniref:pentapeptide repeat-containing protein n=1 Tax=Coleofasciculus sp. G2-EDA-02 TaxID=3069529 RepID=UPI0032F37EAE
MMDNPKPRDSSNANNTNESTPLPEHLQQLLAYFDQLYPIEDSIHLEYELLQVAKRCDLPLESVRQMFKNYCRQHQDKIWHQSRLLFLLSRIEKNLEWLNQSMSKMDLFPVLEYLSKLSIIVALIVFIIEIPERVQQRETEQKRTNYEAWRVILASEGKPASGGRVQALEDLNKQGIPLTNINLSGAFLSDIKLPKARLDGAKLNQTLLNGAKLQKAKLINASLQNAALIDANLKGANLLNADLSNAALSQADLTQVVLKDANLEGANLTDTKGLKILQIKQARNWQSACYDPSLRRQLGLTSVQNPNC